MPAPRDALELLIPLQAATSRDDLFDRLQSAAAQFDLPTLAIVQFATGDSGLTVVASRQADVVTGGLETLQPNDGFRAFLLGVEQPASLTDVSAEVLAKAGVRHGLAVPLRLPERGRGVALLLGNGPLEASDVLALTMLVQTAVAQLAHLNPEASVAAMLTPREREVLRWTAAGKTADASASILGISVRTVEYHLLNAARKLNTANRTHTVVEALRSRQISL